MNTKKAFNFVFWNGDKNYNVATIKTYWIYYMYNVYETM